MSEVQISKTLLIFKSNVNSTAAAEQFLRNREWLVYSTTNLKEFLMYVIQKKPSFVMISVDHPNKKVLMMPKVLIQSFPVCVFTFAESSSSVSFRKLQDVACAYKVNPPATGPAIERTVNKYLRDQEKKIREQNEKPTVDVNGKPLDNIDPNKVTMIQSGATDSTASSNEGINGGNWSQASSIFSQLLEGDDSAKADGVQDGESTQINGAGGLLSAAYSQSEPAGNGDQSWIPLKSATKGNNGGTSGTAGHLHGVGGDYSEENYQSSEGSVSGTLSTKTGSEKGGSIDGNGKAGTLSSGAYSENDYEDIDHDHKLGRRPQNTSIGNQKPNKKYENGGKIITALGKNPGAGRESIILKGTKQALDETVQVNDGIVKQELTESSNVACIVVESTKFNGYLIAALGKNRKMDGQFVKTIQDKLFKFLKENGETVSDKENLNLKIKKIEFEDWALEYAEFLKKSVHNGDEVAMAFFPVTQAQAEIGESASPTMASVKLTEMEGDKQVEFNMYLYLPNNKKYILYTPKGGKFYSNQKGRLEEKGVKEVHMLKSEVNDLAKYRAQNYLNGLIDSYRQKKSTSKAA